LLVATDSPIRNPEHLANMKARDEMKIPGISLTSFATNPRYMAVSAATVSRILVMYNARLVLPMTNNAIKRIAIDGNAPVTMWLGLM